MSDTVQATTSDIAQTKNSRPCKVCSCPDYQHGPFPDTPCLQPKCGHPRNVHTSHPLLPNLETSVLKPVSVKNTGNIVLVFVGDKETFKLAPGQTKPLDPGNYRVQVDITNPRPIVIVIAKIVYDHKLKRFDIQAEDGLKGARFVTLVDLEAVGRQPKPPGAVGAEA